MATFLALRLGDGRLFAPLSKNGRIRFTDSIDKCAMWPESHREAVEYAASKFSTVHPVSVVEFDFPEMPDGFVK